MSSRTSACTTTCQWIGLNGKNVHHTLYIMLAQNGENETRNKGAGGQTGKVQSGQNEPDNTHGRRNADTHGMQVWETTDKEACGLVLGYVMLIQFAARDKDRRAHGQVVCKRSKIDTARRNRRHFPPSRPASARRKKSPAFRETWCSQKSRRKKKKVQYGLT